MLELCFCMEWQLSDVSSRRMEGIFGEREQAHRDFICTSHPSLVTLKARRLERGTVSVQSVKSAAKTVECKRALSLARSRIKDGIVYYM